MDTYENIGPFLLLEKVFGKNIKIKKRNHCKRNIFLTLFRILHMKSGNLNTFSCYKNKKIKKIFSVFNY